MVIPGTIQARRKNVQGYATSAKSFSKALAASTSQSWAYRISCVILRVGRRGAGQSAQAYRAGKAEADGLVERLVRVLATFLLGGAESSISRLLILSGAKVETLPVRCGGHDGPVCAGLANSLFVMVEGVSWVRTLPILAERRTW